MRERHYEVDDEAFPHGAYRVIGHPGVAWSVLGWETEPDEDTEWSGYEARTGKVLAVMVGDDRRFAFGAEDLAGLARAEYCGECGQVGCTHDGQAGERSAGR